MTTTLPRGAYPERLEDKIPWLDQFAGSFSRVVRRRFLANSLSLKKFVARVSRHGKDFAGASRQTFTESALELRQRFRAEGFKDDHIARAFALVREVSEQVLQQRHYDVQLMGGWVLLQGMVSEMETGEGKTLTATLAASTSALAGVPVHIITVNDYLTRRDARCMMPIYEALGLSVGAIVHGMDHESRQAAYRCDITYCTNKEIAFDYLRDRILLNDNPSSIHLRLERLHGSHSRDHRLLLRGLHYAIVDEADSVLIDEARTPLIISGSHGGEEERKIYDKALELAKDLTVGRHYKLVRKEQTIELTGAGRGKLQELSKPLGGVWKRRRKREELVHQALTASVLFSKDRHYLIRDGKVEIIDEYTGRTMPDRSWEHGLHQAIEAKEGCPITKQNRALARISYQRFFRRYHKLAGMTGTAREVAAEFGAVYKLSCVRVSTNRPLRRTRLGNTAFADASSKWRAIVERIQDIHASGRPILVGTRSVKASEHLSALLNEAGLSHQVLNARQDREEADIIAGAGKHARITVATNMAGRGTDIRLEEGIPELGGLHVIATELHDARRIDRQLFGRSGRQGDPGSYEAFMSLEDELIEQFAGTVLKRLCAYFKKKSGRLPAWITNGIFATAQHTAQQRHFQARKDLLRMDEYLEKALAFSGSSE